MLRPTAPRNRRPVTRSSQPQPILGVTGDGDRTGHSVSFGVQTLALVVDSIIATPAKMSLTGVPKILRSATNTFPVSAAIDNTQEVITITYDASEDPIAANEEFGVPPYDNAIRLPQGGWVAPGKITALP